MKCVEIIFIYSPIRNIDIEEMRHNVSILLNQTNNIIGLESQHENDQIKIKNLLRNSP